MLMHSSITPASHWSPHDAVGEQEVPAQAGGEQVGAEQLLEQLRREAVPRDGVRDGREDPVQLAQHSAPVRHLTGDPGGGGLLILAYQKRVDSQ